MPLNLDLADAVPSGPAITPAFLRDGIEAELRRLGLLSDAPVPPDQSTLPRLAAALGYGKPVRQSPVATREGPEDGGWRLPTRDGGFLRAWWHPGLDLNAPDAESRTSPTRAAQRVLLTLGEPAGLITGGDSIRLLLCDPARADSHLTIRPDAAWPLLRALAGAAALPHLPAIQEAARLHQVRVTTGLRRQAREAITGFVNALPDLSGLDPAALWREALVLVYRLLFVLKLESPSASGAGFSFAATALWRTALSPNLALGPLVRRHLDRGTDTASMLETGLRTLFRLFRDGLSCAELHIAPLGGALFGPAATPLRDRLAWGDRAAAVLLDRLIWSESAAGERVRVHYGALDVEELGGIYESLLEQEPAIAAGRFVLRAGLGRKSTGSFYTPHEFVRFLVSESLAPLIAERSPPDDPHPTALLRLKIVDPAMGSGHFLVEACRQLGDALLAACLACDARGLHDRIAALPDPDNSLAAYLPAHGFCEPRARAICRRLVAVHCLYGCDRNGLAVELAKLSLWLESWAEGLPLTFLDHRLVQGDALSGPFFADLATLPAGGGPLDPLLARGVADRLTAAMDRARSLAASLDASIGRDVADLGVKQAAKYRLDAVLDPLRQLAGAWAGAAMTGGRDADDAWLALARHVAETGAWPAALTPAQAAMARAGRESLAWDLAFPDVFPAGFSVVLGNPPWDVVLANTKDFLSGLDEPADVPPSETLARPDIAAAFAAYRDGFEQTKRIAARLYRHQRVGLGSGSATGNLDLFRLFAERGVALAAADGMIGLLLPSAFHANEGATGIRRLYLRDTALTWLLSFENRRRVFDIDSRFKFDLVVARRPGPTQSVRCGFYLGRIADAADPARIMTYGVPFLARAGGAALTPLELSGGAALAVAERLFAGSERLEPWCAERGIRFGCDLHMTDDAGLFRRPGAGLLTVHEGKTFHQYTDAWTARPRYAADPAAVRPAVAAAARHYRLAFRDIARSNDARTMIAFIAPPDAVFGHTATVEKTPWLRPNADALALCAVFNSFIFDWLVRQKAATHLSLYLVGGLPVPALHEPARRFLAHAALLLSCRHAGYDALWREQAGPVRVDADLAAIRLAADAVVAAAFGLDRAGYRHVLAGFNHRTAPDVPDACLAAFDALTRSGMAAFCRQRDPLAGRPLVNTKAIPADTALVFG